MILVKDMLFALICAPIATASARPFSLQIPLRAVFGVVGSPAELTA